MSRSLPSRSAWWAVLAVGAVLAVVPLILAPPGKLGAGQRLIANFQPLMSPAAVAGGAKLLAPPPHADAGATAAVRTVAGRLTPLFASMKANTGNYAEVSSLPDFRLFTWFFLVPGLVLVALAGVALTRRATPNVGEMSSPGGARRDAALATISRSTRP